MNHDKAEAPGSPRADKARAGVGTSIEAVWLAERAKFREAAARKDAKAALAARHAAVAARAARVVDARRIGLGAAPPHGLGYGSMPSALVSSVGRQALSNKCSAPATSLASRHTHFKDEGGCTGPAVGPAAYGLPRLGAEQRGGRLGEKNGVQAFSRDGAAPAAHKDLAAAAAAGASRGQLLRTLGRSAGLVEADRLAVPGPSAYTVNQGDITRPPAYTGEFDAPSKRRGATLLGRTVFGDYTQTEDVADEMGPGRCREDSTFGRPGAPTQKQPPRFSLRSRVAFGAVKSIGTLADEPTAASYSGGFAHGAMGSQVESSRRSAGAAPLSGPWRSEAVEHELAGGGPGVCREDTLFPPRPPKGERREDGTYTYGSTKPQGGLWGKGFVAEAAAAAASFEGGATVPAMNACV